MLHATRYWITGQTEESSVAARLPANNRGVAPVLNREPQAHVRPAWRTRKRCQIIENVRVLVATGGHCRGSEVRGLSNRSKDSISSSQGNSRAFLSRHGPSTAHPHKCCSLAGVPVAHQFIPHLRIFLCHHLTRAGVVSDRGRGTVRYFLVLAGEKGEGQDGEGRRCPS